MMLALSLLSDGVGAVLTLALLGVLFALDVRRADRRPTPRSAHLPALVLGGLFALVVVVRFAVYA
jgi:hypothetical protein